MNNILFINACDREDSRTKRLADAVLNKLSGSVNEVRLADEGLVPIPNDEIELRHALIEAGDYSHPMFRYAKAFAEADLIVVAAPYWDLSFPSELKVFIERITVRGLTFVFTPDGRAEGLCHAKKLIYVTTVGAEGLPHDFGFGYIKAVCQAYYGIDNVELVSAEGLDIFGNDAEEILKKAIEKL